MATTQVAAMTPQSSSSPNRHHHGAGPVPVAPSRPSPFCCCGRRSVKVNPVVGSYPGYDIFEIRPGRHLRIMHLNPRKRDDRFHWDMEKFMAAQVKSGKYGTRGKSWKLPQPGRMDKTVSFEQYKQSLINRTKQNLNGVGGMYGTGALSSYQSYNGDLTVNQAYQGEDNLSFRAESPDVEQTSLRSETQNGTLPCEKRKVSQSNSLHSGLVGPQPQGDGSFHTVKSAALDSLKLTRASTATSVHLRMVDNMVESRCPESESTKPTPNESNANTTKHAQNGRVAEQTDALPLNDPDREKTVIFFIHGVGGSAGVWQAQADYFLREGYEVVMPELIGHGFSCAPQTSDAYHFNEIACDLLVIFDLYCKRKNMVIGHSYGSSFATVLARQRSRLVTQLVMVSGGSPTPLAPQPGTFSAPTWLLACCKPVLNRGFRRSAFHNKKLHTLMGQAFDVPTYVLKYTMNGQLWLEGGEDYHRWLTPPTLLIYGRQDKLVTLDEEQEMERIVIGSLLEVIEGASHMVMMEQPDMVNNLLHRFLIGKLKVDTSPAQSEADFKSMNNSRASLRSNKSVPSGLVAGNLK